MTPHQKIVRKLHQMVTIAEDVKDLMAVTPLPGFLYNARSRINMAQIDIRDMCRDIARQAAEVALRDVLKKIDSHMNFHFSWREGVRRGSYIYLQVDRETVVKPAVFKKIPNTVHCYSVVLKKVACL